MKNITIISILTIFCIAFNACKKDDAPNTNYGIDPATEQDLVNTALKIDGQLISGSMPTPTASGSNPISISSSFSIFEVSAGTELMFPIITNIDSSICKVYLQVKDAEKYWEVPIVRDSFGQISIKIFVPNFVNNNSFTIVFSVADCHGNISQPVTTTISVTDTPTLILGANGTPRFNLQFSSTQVDFDLHVITPLGNHIYYSNKTADGGKLDVDCICCSNPGENIYWQPGTAPTGVYEYWVRFFGNSCGGGLSSLYILRVYNNSTVVQFHSGALTSVGQESQHFYFTFP